MFKECRIKVSYPKDIDAEKILKIRVDETIQPGNVKMWGEHIFATLKNSKITVGTVRTPPWRSKERQMEKMLDLLEKHTSKSFMIEFL